MSYLKRIIHNCKQATFLIEKRQQAKLSFREAIELRIHLRGCDLCRLYNSQSQMIGNMVYQLYKESMDMEFKLDEDFKKDLHKRVEKHLGKN